MTTAPCPFCDAGLDELHADDESTRIFVRCRNCGARGPGFCSTEERAWEMWIERPEVVRTREGARGALALADALIKEARSQRDKAMANLAAAVAEVEQLQEEQREHEREMAAAVTAHEESDAAFLDAADAAERAENAVHDLREENHRLRAVLAETPENVEALATVMRHWACCYGDSGASHVLAALRARAEKP
jgi:chromosome segregation ATPase